MNIFLIGYRGTGKTTVAKLLAERLGQQWVDADIEIERRAGKSIAQIFADEGEESFRDLESAVVAELAARDGLIIALGGGAILREQNRRALATRGPVIWLQASAETIHTRIATDTSTATRRPNLTSTGGLAEIQDLLARRDPIYRQCADCQIDTESKTPDQIVGELAEWLSNQSR
jgi:shikimate kinase